MSLWRRALDRVAHLIWDEAARGSRRESVGDYLCWVATEWPGFRR